MSEKISVLIVEPLQRARISEIENTLEAQQKIVGGFIEAIYPYDDKVAIVCNDEGKINGMQLNRAIRDDRGKICEIIAGTFIVCGLTDDSFGGLPPELADKYKKLFYNPEEFLMTSKGIIAIPTKPSIQKELNRKVKEKGKMQREPQAPKRDKPPEL